MHSSIRKSETACTLAITMMLKLVKLDNEWHPIFVGGAYKLTERQHCNCRQIKNERSTFQYTLDKTLGPVEKLLTSQVSVAQQSKRICTQYSLFIKILYLSLILQRQQCCCGRLFDFHLSNASNATQKSSAAIFAGLMMAKAREIIKTCRRAFLMRFVFL